MTSKGTHSRKRRLGAIALAGSLIFAACGDDDTEANADPAPTAAAVADDSSADDNMAADSMTEDAFLGAFGPACGAVPEAGEGSFAGMADDPAATAASNNPLLSTLVTAVTEAGLVDTLNSEGPFTVFAPTNDAFAAIDADTLNMVLADKELLTTILTYHVVPGNSKASDLAAAGSLGSVEGGELTFGADGTTVNDVDVLCSDIPTANATVHVIGSVLLPPAVVEALAAGAMGEDSMDEDAMGEDSMGEDSMDEDAMGDDSMDADMVALAPTGPGCAAVPADGEGSFVGMADDPAATAASNNPLLSTLVTAVSQAGLVDTLNSEGPFTIFAPVNDAFAAIPEEDLAAVLADQDLLTTILTHHVIIGDSWSSADLVEAGTAITANGTELTFANEGGALMVNGASTLCMDVPTANATVHIIDAVLIP